jgi:hypothetical protein
MCTVEKAKAVIAGAQSSLRELMEAAIRQHRYGEVAEIAGLAEGLSKLLVGGAAPEPDPTPPAASRDRAKPGTERPSGGRQKARGNAAYPRFERDGDKLVKIGWSKKHKDEYEHRAAREVVIAVARHVASRVKPGQVFEVENLLPMPDSAGAEIPAYQVYLTLGWLRDAGALEKKGRDGQVLRDGSIATGGLDKLWEKVPVRTT